MRRVLIVLGVLAGISGCARAPDPGPSNLGQESRSFEFEPGTEPRVTLVQLYEFSVILERGFRVRESSLYRAGLFVARAAGADPATLTAVDVVARVHDAAQDSRWIPNRTGKLWFDWDRNYTPDGALDPRWVKTRIAINYSGRVAVTDVYIMPIPGTGPTRRDGLWRIERLTLVDA